jgi:putative nucleotidyltransferase with HDIG domain
MRLTKINNKILNETLAMPVYSSNGNILINKGCVCTKNIISNIQKHGINIVYVENEYNNIHPQEIIDISTRFKIIKALKTEFNKVKKTYMLDDNILYDIINDLIKNINYSENAFLFNSISHIDDDIKLYDHCLNVTILAIKMGIEKKFDNKKLINLAYAALLHDIGKIIDEKNHCQIGYEIVKTFKPSMTTIYTSILNHHENEDGTGPNKVYGDKIYEFAKIINICNTYVNKVNFELPNAIIEEITALAVNKFDKDIYSTFINTTYCYPNGLTIILNNGLKGTVIKQNEHFPLRPIIGIMFNGEPKLLDLNNPQSLTLSIEKVII